MSRKTKKEKIIADLRRQLAQRKSSESVVQSSEYKYKPEIIVPVVPATNSELPTTNYTTDYSYVKKDLVKTLVLTGLAICVQVVLWYVLGRR